MYSKKFIEVLGLDMHECYKKLNGGVDLHIHTDCSDGTFSAQEVIAAARNLGLKAISITDHATTKAYESICNIEGINILPGVEISTQVNNFKIHILGYGEAILETRFQERLKEIRKMWNKRFYDMLMLFNMRNGYNISRKKLENLEKETIDIDDLCLVISSEIGMHSNKVRELFFDKQSMKSCYISYSAEYIPNTYQLLEFMKNEGIMGVLAHTRKIDLSINRVDLKKLKLCGLYGVEVFHPKLTQYNSKENLELCYEMGLYPFGGSDFHGINKPNILGSCAIDEMKRIPFFIYAISILHILNLAMHTKQREMTIEEKITLLLRPSYIYSSFDDKSEYLIKEYGQMYSRIDKTNYKSIEEFVYGMNYILENSAFPLWINVNQEGGRLNTIDWDGENLFPGNNSLGRNNITIVEKSAELMARQLRSIGLTWNLAPVADIFYEKNNKALLGRCFSSIPEHVANYTEAFVRGLQKGGVAATAKHFPGIGHAERDPHDGLSYIDTISEDDLKPFVAAIRAGVACIMVSSVVIKNIDSNKPACMSRRIMTDLLRKRLGFEGIIVTENISLLAHKDMTIEDVALESFLAGADIVLFDPDLSRGIYSSSEAEREKVKKFHISRNLIYNKFLWAIREGVISQERLNDSYNRIVSVMDKYGIKDKAEIDFKKYCNLVEETKKLLDEIALNSVTIVYEREGFYLNKKEIKVAIVQIRCRRDMKADSSFANNIPYKEILTELGIQGDVFIISEENCEFEIIGNYDYVILISYNMHVFPSELILFDRLVEYSKNMIVIGTGECEELKYMKEKDICIYVSAGSMIYTQLKQAFNLVFEHES